MDISTFVVNPVTLALLVMFLVQFIKDLGLKGNVLRFVSLAIGAILAFTFKLRELEPAWASYIDVSFFVLAVGLGACGLYSLIDERIPKTGGE
jgi:hypothetical protein